MTVLATKLHVPAPRPDLVARPRLRALLEAAADPTTRLVLVSAPAGFGKTTMLTQWLAGGGEPPSRAVAWVSLDDADDDVRRFLAHMIAALRTTNPEVGAEAATVLDTAASVPVDTILTSLVNDLDTLAGPTVLVLDDFHAVTATVVHEAVAFLVDHLPAHSCLAMTTRSDPPFALARLRSTGGLVEVRAADLRFTDDEAATLLNDVRGLGLTPEQVATLDQRTEGWAAGLQLAAMSLRGRDDPAAFVEAFAGSHRFVLDYLIEEVLQRQPDELRGFLLDTSILGELSPSLCQAVTGRPDAQALLESLERQGLFVVPLDDRREWWRYHHLFAEALRVRLQATDPLRVGGLHRAAAQWYAEHGRLVDAVGHAAAGGDLEAAADLVELAVPDVRRRRRSDLLVDFVGMLPEEVLRRRPLLAVVAAWARLNEGDLDGVERWLADAERGTAATATAAAAAEPGSPLARAVAAREQDRRQLPAIVAVYRASVAQARGEVGGTIAQARRAWELTGPDDHFARGAAGGFLGLAAWASGDLETAVDTFGQAVDSLRAAGNVADALGATVVLGLMWRDRGRPDEARRLLEHALAEAERQPGPLASTGDLEVALADMLREQGDLDGAAAHLATARELGDLASLPENRHRWFAASAGLREALGDLEGALALFDRAAALYQPGFFPDVRPLAALRARVQVAAGDLAGAATWARQAGVGLDDAPTFATECARLTLARLRIAEHRADPGLADPAGVLALLDRAVAEAEAGARGGGVVEARMVRALAHDARGATHLALDDLAAALLLGMPVGYRRLFLDEGPPMTRLLRTLARDRPGDPAAASAGRLLADTDRPAPPPPRGRDEALSDRELEVLRLLASDLTGPEIARHLYVTVNTLRTHTKHIFTKLDVNTRRAAVRRAEERGLL